jgi:MATE family multidrug resistance protein
MSVPDEVEESIGTALWKLIKIAVPITLAQATSIGVYTINAAFIGHSVARSGSDQGFLELATSLTNLLYLVLFGHVAGLDTIISQGYGAKNEGRVRRGLAHFLSAMVIELVFLLGPACALVAYTIKATSHVDVSKLQLFLYLLGITGSYPLRRSMGRFLGMTDGEGKLFMCTLVTLTLTIIMQGLVMWRIPPSPRRLHYLLLTEVLAGLGVVIFAVVVVLWFHRKARGYLPGRKEFAAIWTVAQWRAYFGLSFVAGLVSLLDMGSVTGLSVLAALLPDTRYIAVCSNGVAIVVLLFSVAGGLTTAATAVVGRRVGERNKKGALRMARIAYSLAFVVSVTDGALLMIGRHAVSRLYSDDEFVVSKMEALIPVLAVAHVMDVLQMTAQGIFRALGRPSVGVRIQLVSMFLFGLPLGVALAWAVHMNALGLWLGQLAGYVVLASVSVGWTLIKWGTLIEKAIAEVKEADEDEAQRQSLVSPTADTAGSYGAVDQLDVPPPVNNIN